MSIKITKDKNAIIAVILYGLYGLFDFFVGTETIFYKGIMPSERI